ncbi:hypothetical protein [Martelella sp. FOR1707]
MGNIAVLWGQVDEALNAVLAWTLNLPPDVFDSLLGNQMIGARVCHLPKIADTATLAPEKVLLREVHDKLKDVLPRRNAAMHGCWGQFVEDPSFQKLKAGIYNRQKPKARFFADELPKLHDDICNVLRLLNELLMYSVEEDPEPTDFNNNKIYFAPQPPDQRSAPLRFERGDRVVPVPSTSPDW